MARAVEQIKRDIVAVEEAVSAIATELNSAYASYLKTLGQSVRQHLVLASYQLCTQGYPKSFLNLSFSQRQQLQQAIRNLSQNTVEELLLLIKTEEAEDRKSDLSPEASPPLSTDVQEPEEILDLTQNDRDRSKQTYTQIPFKTTGIAPGKATSLTPAQNSPPCPSHPQQLAQWQQRLEEAIANSLKSVSRETNFLLQQAGILPKKLTPPLLEAAATASEAATEMVTEPPNIINLLIEAEDHEQPEDSNVTQIIAIHLRLSEIEFADAAVRAGRNQIRNLEARVRTLGREYQKKQRERVVAEAEAAWRVSWFDE